MQSYRTFIEHSDSVYHIAFSPNGKLLASASRDGTVLLWDVYNEQLLVRLTPAKDSKVVSVAFSPDGKWLACCCENGSVVLWQMRQWRHPKVFSKYDPQCVAFSPDSQMLLAASFGSVSCLSLSQLTWVRDLDLPEDELWVSLVFSPDGKTLATTSGEGSVVFIDTDRWHSDLSPQVHLDGIGPVYRCVFSPVQTYCAVSQTIRHEGPIGQSTYPDENFILVWDRLADSKFQPRRLVGHLGWIGGLAYSQHGAFLASGSYDETVRLWDARDYSLIAQFREHEGAVYAVAFSPIDDILASCSTDCTIKLWRISDVQRGSTVLTRRPNQALTRKQVVDTVIGLQRYGRDGFLVALQDILDALVLCRSLSEVSALMTELFVNDDDPIFLSIGLGLLQALELRSFQSEQDRNEREAQFYAFAYALIAKMFKDLLQEDKPEKITQPEIQLPVDSNESSDTISTMSDSPDLLRILEQIKAGVIPQAQAESLGQSLHLSKKDIENALVWTYENVQAALRGQASPANLSNAAAFAFQLIQNDLSLEERANFANQTGILFSLAGNNIEALRWFEQASAWLQDKDIPELRTNTLGNLANVYRNVHRLEDALRAYEEAIAIAERHQLTAPLINHLSNLSIVYHDLEQYEQEERTLLRVHQLAQTSGTLEQQIGILNGLGTLARSQNKPQDALQYYKEALILAEQGGNERYRLTLLSNIGLVHQDLGESDAALSDFKQAWDLTEHGDNREETINTLHQLVNFYLGQRNYTAAEEVVQNAQRRGEMSNNKQYQDALTSLLLSVQTNSLLATLPVDLAQWLLMSDPRDSQAWLETHLRTLPDDAPAQLEHLTAEAHKKGLHHFAWQLEQHARLIMVARRISVQNAYQELILLPEPDISSGIGSDYAAQYQEHIDRQIEAWSKAPDHGEASLKASLDLFTLLQQVIANERQERFNAETANICLQLLTIDDSIHMLAPDTRACVFQVRGRSLEMTIDMQQPESAQLQLHEAISCYEKALVLHQPALWPTNWAETQVYKAIAYERLTGFVSKHNQIDALRTAITCYDAALSVFVAENRSSKQIVLLERKSHALVGLGILLSGSEQQQEFHEATTCFDTALSDFPPEVRPLEWAELQQGKGNALRAVAPWLGSAARSDAFSKAIQCFDHALQKYTPQETPYRWAETMLAKGICLTNLSQNDPDRSTTILLLHEAVTCFDNALSEYTRETVPSSWREIQIEKGAALNHLAGYLTGVEQLQMYLESVRCLDQALRECSFGDEPEKWADINYRKANFLLQLVRLTGGNSALKGACAYAIDSCDNALQVWQRESAPYRWAQTQATKGHILRSYAWLQYADQEPFEECRNYLEQAIDSYDQSLLVFEPSKTLTDWATVQDGKAGVMVQLEKLVAPSERKQVIETAITYFEQAQTAFTLELNPREYLQISGALALRHLALISYLDSPEREQHLDLAWKIISSALEASKRIEHFTILLSDRQAVWAELAPVYTAAAIIQALRGHAIESVQFIEAGRSRLLADVQRQRHADLELLTASEHEEYIQAVQTIMDIEARSLLYQELNDKIPLIEEAQKSYAQFAAVVARIQQRLPSFLADTPISVPQLIPYLRPGEAYVYLLPHEPGMLLLIIPHTGSPRVRWFTDLTLSDLYELAAQPSASGAPKLGYLPAAAYDGLTPLNQALDQFLPELGARCMREVMLTLCQMEITHAIVVPGGTLAVLPLHAAMYQPLSASDVPTAPNGLRYACDDAAISYAPSGAAYIVAKEARARLGKPRQGFVVGNPKLTPTDEPWKPDMPGYLLYAEAEAARVANVMQQAGMEVAEAWDASATWAAVVKGLQKADIAHLAMHAVFDVSDPLSSALLVASGEKLSLRDLLNPRILTLNHLRLAVLSACQSGLVDFNRQREEMIGLLSALLVGGAAGVVGSFWPVYDGSTQLLMEAFMQRYLLEEQEPWMALRNAARWLRGLPDEVLDDQGRLVSAKNVIPTEAQVQFMQTQRLVDEFLSSRIIPHPQLVDGRNPLETQRKSSLTHPVHWAAFTYFGA